MCSGRTVCTGFYEPSMIPKRSQRFAAHSLISNPLPKRVFWHSALHAGFGPGFFTISSAAQIIIGRSLRNVFSTHHSTWNWFQVNPIDQWHISADQFNWVTGDKILHGERGQVLPYKATDNQLVMMVLCFGPRRTALYKETYQQCWYDRNELCLYLDIIDPSSTLVTIDLYGF